MKLLSWPQRKALKLAFRLLRDRLDSGAASVSAQGQQVPVQTNQVNENLKKGLDLLTKVLKL